MVLETNTLKRLGIGYLLLVSDIGNKYRQRLLHYSFHRPVQQLFVNMDVKHLGGKRLFQTPCMHIWFFDGYGLGSLGVQAAKRGLQLIEFQGGGEGIEEQLEDAPEPAEDRKGKAYKIKPSVLAEIQRALQLEFQSRSSILIAQLYREAIPDFDQIPIKRPLTPEDFPLPDPAEILPVLQEIQKEKSFFSRLACIFSRK